MSGGGGGPNPQAAIALEEEKARQAELRRQAELSRLGRGRRLASVVGDEFFEASSLLGGGDQFGKNPLQLQLKKQLSQDQKKTLAESGNL